MKNGKYMLILQSFSKSEMRDFGKFLTYKLQKRHKCNRFFTYITKFSERNHAFNDQKIFSYVYDNKPFKLTQLSKLKSEFLHWLEVYIISRYSDFTFIKNNQTSEDTVILSVEQKFVLFDFYLYKPIKELCLEAFIEIQNEFDKYPYRGTRYYKIKYEINEKARLLGSRIQSKLLQPYFLETQRDLNNFYWISNLKLILQNINTQIRKSFTHTVDLRSIESIPIEEIQQEVGVYTWYLVVQFSLSKYDFDKTYEHLKNTINLFPKYEARMLLTPLENFLGKDSPNFKGITRYKKVIDLYDLQLQQGIIQQTQTLVPALFNNIITAALKLKDETEKDYVQWAEEFLQENYKYLVIGDSREEKKLKEVILPYNQARCLWVRRKFQEALALVYPILEQDNKGLDAMQKLKVDRLVLQICYELEEVEELEKSIAKLRTYISRNKEGIGKIAVNAYLKMIEISKQLFVLQEKMRYAYKYQPSEEELEEIRKRIEATQYLYEREWLLEKYQEIIKKIK